MKTHVSIHYLGGNVGFYDGPFGVESQIGVFNLDSDWMNFLNPQEDLEEFNNVCKSLNIPPLADANDDNENECSIDAVYSKLREAFKMDNHQLVSYTTKDDKFGVGYHLTTENDEEHGKVFLIHKFEIPYQPYEGGAGPTPLQCHINNLHLISKLQELGIFDATLGPDPVNADADDHSVIHIKLNGETLYCSYDRWGYWFTHELYLHNDDKNGIDSDNVPLGYVLAVLKSKL